MKINKNWSRLLLSQTIKVWNIRKLFVCFSFKYMNEVSWFPNLSLDYIIILYLDQKSCFQTGNFLQANYDLLMHHKNYCETLLAFWECGPKACIFHRQMNHSELIELRNNYNSGWMIKLISAHLFRNHSATAVNFLCPTHYFLPCAKVESIIIKW